MDLDPPPAPYLEYMTRIEVEVGDPVEVGKTYAGRRRVVPIQGGTVTGPLLNGRILPGGAYFQLIRSAEISELEARYIVATESGDRLYVTNLTYRTGSAEDISALARGEQVRAERLYFRCSPRFEASGAELAWLESTVVVGSGSRKPGRVIIDLGGVR